MTETLQALIAAREHLAETIPEPTERQRWALDDLDRAIDRLADAMRTNRDNQPTMFGSER